MNEPMIEVLMNGTNAAEAAGQIGALDAATLRQELAHAAALDTDPVLTPVILRSEDVGDEDCRKLIHSIYSEDGHTHIKSDSSRAVLLAYCRDNGLEVVADSECAWL